MVDDPVEVPLVVIAHARSGDKGPDSNIGVRARHPDFLSLLRDQLSADVVVRWFAHRFARGANPEESVVRHDVPGIDALNFVLRDALGGGGGRPATPARSASGAKGTAAPTTA